MNGKQDLIVQLFARLQTEFSSSWRDNLSGRLTFEFRSRETRGKREREKKTRYQETSFEQTVISIDSTTL